MKVMIVGGDQMKYFGQRYYGYASKLRNGFIRNNHMVVRFYDRDISRLSNVLRSRLFGVAKANEKLLQQAESLRPDLILFIHADVILPETLERLREAHPATKIAQISVDALFIPRNVERLTAKSHLVDATFMTTAGEGLKKISGGHPAYYIPNITDSSIETGRAFDAACEHDLFFACGSFEREGGDPREETLNLIGERLFNIRFSCNVHSEMGGLWGADYMDTIGRSKCGLNLSRDREGPLSLAGPEDLYVYSSDRVANLTGNGALTFTHRKYSLDRLFSDDEMIFYDSNEDLINKIAHFLENEDGRRRIARNGWEKAHQHLNERLTAQYIIDVLFREDLSHPYIWPTERII